MDGDIFLPRGLTAVMEGSCSRRQWRHSSQAQATIRTCSSFAGLSDWMNQQGLNCSAGCASMWLREISMTTTRISRSLCTRMVIGNWLRLMTSLLQLTSGGGLMMTSIRWGYIPRDAIFQNKTSSLSVKISRFRSL